MDNMSETTLNDHGSDDFVVVDESTRDLPLRTKAPNAREKPKALTVDLHPLPQSQSFVVSVQPPAVPEGELIRPSCDIILVIDVSGSMSAAAPLPDVDDVTEKEAAGLSVLDLTKHAARTILATLTDDDRLGIVTFSTNAEVIQDLTPMTANAKALAQKRIESLHDFASTNLWAGIRTGLDLFEKATFTGNVQGLYVLTDGMPNHMCPPQGYVAKLGPMLKEMATTRPCIPTIHTFGFGYSIRSELMQSIAEVGQGSYSFIPDAGMIGTVFVHAVANLFTTFAVAARLELKGPKRGVLKKKVVLKPTAGLRSDADEVALVIALGNLQYGQSRDLVIECPGMPADSALTAVLRYQRPAGDARELQSHILYSAPATMAPADVAYHQSRAEICSFLSSLFPLKDNGERTTLSGMNKVADAHIRLATVAASIQASPFAADKKVASLVEDLVGEDEAGQVSKALVWDAHRPYWIKWGRHYLPSLLHAHQRQVCNTFKDPGPLLYGQDSPLFIKWRDLLDHAFDNLPAPKPSRPERVEIEYDARGTATPRSIPHRSVGMHSYNSRSNPCFEGHCLVAVADGSTIPIKSLRPGALVWTPTGGRKVAAVLQSRMARRGSLCRVGELLVTPWHPIQAHGSWVFPIEVAENVVPFRGRVYSVLLAPSRDPCAHAIEVGGQVCVTLGHGLTDVADDPRSHVFFGNYRRVVQSLSGLPRDAQGRTRCGGMTRDARTGLAKGFVAPTGSVRVKNRAVRASCSHTRIRAGA